MSIRKNTCIILLTILFYFSLTILSSCKSRNGEIYKIEKSKNNLDLKIDIIKKLFYSQFSDWYIGLPKDGKLIIKTKGDLTGDSIQEEVRIYSFTDTCGKEFRNLYLFQKKNEMWYLNQVYEKIILTPEESKCDEPLNNVKIYKQTLEVSYIEPETHSWNSLVKLKIIEDQLFIISEEYVEYITPNIFDTYFFDPINGELTISTTIPYTEAGINGFSIEGSTRKKDLAIKKPLNVVEYKEHRNLPKYEKRYHYE